MMSMANQSTKEKVEVGQGRVLLHDQSRKHCSCFRDKLSTW